MFVGGKEMSETGNEKREARKRLIEKRNDLKARSYLPFLFS